MASATILAFKAGRAFRREGTNFVDHSPEKGAIILQKGEDELLHFVWKNRSTNDAEEDLILFPGDASFVKIPQVTGGRSYVLKFSSSNQRHFFWMQDASTARDDEFVKNLNLVLEDPDRIPVWQAGGAGSSQGQASTSQAGSSSQSAAAPSGTTPEQLAQIRSLVQSMSGNTAQNEPELSLTDILTPETLLPLFRSHPDLVSSLFPHLPPDLPTPPSQETLQQIISSPQFRGAVRNLDQALRTGLLGGLVRGLGLPEEAGTGVEAFLRAIQEQAGRGDRMETD